ncbi:hypothetical protein [Aneurinibacillus tyrosinisolvens]|uniref:hypothetical protein n=1 Tax=Aneurinibacillus tyrosinisolvens TaxID=1443435 RepID=UPI00063FC038|nr:hypothetical protein [Aneurinibacillus tyrosinisolvens]
MRNLVKQFSEQYAADMDKQTYSTDEQRSLHNPIVFLFIGDRTLDALNAMYELNATKWNNSTGVLYAHIYSTKTAERTNVYSFRIEEPAEDKKQLRRRVYEQFYENESRLIELNRMMRQVSSRVSEFGNMYSSFERMNVAVVTRADDPLNVLLPEITLLMKNVFSESFRIVNLDLYTLIKEKTAGEDFAFTSSLGVSFLREIEYYQAENYRFHEMLQVTEDHIKLPVEHPPSPLFDLVYLLSDRDERGIIMEHSMETNYEIICSINLLKNRKAVTNPGENNASYSNIQFKRNIHPESGRTAYASAGFAKVKRPNRTIALTVLLYFYETVIDRLKQCASLDKKQVLELFELAGPSLGGKLRSFVPGEERIEEMTSLMPMRASYTELKKLTLRQAEERLYSDAGQAFFEKNFVQAARSAVKQSQFTQQVKQLVYTKIIDNPRYGLYSAFFWTSEKHPEQSMMEELRKAIRETARQAEAERIELDEFYEERVELQNFSKAPLPFMDKTNVKNFIRHFFAKIYGKKLEILLLEIKLELLKVYEHALEDIHGEIEVQVAELKELENLLRNASRDSLVKASADLDRNISPYYRTVAGQIIQDMEAKRSPFFYFEERFLGNTATLLRSGTAALLQRLTDMCRRDILSYAQFQLSFEEELLQRANVAAAYENRHVLSKEELFKELYRILEENAAIHIDVYHYTHKHRYEEKYFFGDFDSDFIRYAFDSDDGKRTYKLGCVHEKRSSGMEKLNIMGGFHIDDVMFYRNAQKYYHTYIENGFQFHGIGEEHLPPIGQNERSKRKDVE